MKKNNYTKKIRLLLFTLALFLSSQSIYAQSSSFVLSIPGMNLSFLNANRTLIYNAGNNGLAAGSKWRYDNLLSTDGITIYGVITIQEINNASIDVLDDETYGLPGRFQPRITSNTGGGYVLFQLEFFEVVTNNRVYISNYYFTAVDIDGGEYVELGGYSSYQVDATCGLTITNNATTGRTRFGGITTDLSNITFENTASFVASYVFPYTKVTFALGKSSAGSSRQYSTQFGTAGGTFNNPVTTKNPLKLIYISKTCDADKFVAGSTHKYSVTLENSGSVADSVKLSDPLPTGLTYVPHSTSIYIPAANATETVADNFNTQSYVQNSGTVQWSSDWVEGGADATTSPIAGTIQITTGGVLQFSSTTSAPLTNGTFIDRNIDLKRAQSATLTFDYPAIALSTGALSVQLSSDGNIYTTVGTLTGTTAGSFSYTIPSTYFTKNTHLRFVNATGSSWANGRNISIDNVKITYGFSKAAETKTNALSGGTLSNGVPPNLLTNADQITLLPGVKATLTFDVTVNCDASGTITNTATATCPNLYDNSISASHIATVDPTNVTGASRCGNGSVTLSAAGASGNQTYRWYNAPSGGSILGTGSTFTTPNISSSTDYYVSFYNPDTGCETGRTKVTATISAGISGTGTISSTTGQNGAALNSGTISPTTASNNTTSGTVAWSNLTNITADDGSMVSATMAASALSNNLDITGFNFSSVPAGSQIVGISVTVNRNAGTASTVLDNTIQLLKSGTAVGDNKATTTTWPTTSGGANATYGTTTDAWGVTWTGADLSNIGLRIQAKRNTTTGNVAANIDYVSITVYYSTFGDDQSSVNFAVSGITGATGYNWTVPTGATITSGQGTDNILVNFNNAGQSGTYSVCATPQDACGSGSQICQTIYISNNTNNEISGTVYNDPDGSVAPNKVDGTPVSSIGGQQLYAILTTNSDSKAISSITVAPDGTYKFSYLTSTTSNYYRIYINTRPFGDAVVASAGLPSGAVFNGAIDNDATNSLTGGSSTNGYITVTAGNNTNNTNVNFGIKINNPVANNDASTINEDAVATINILTNDVPVSPATINASTVDLDPATSGIQTALNTDNGSWSVSSGIVTFTPNPNYFGKDSINYTITDSNGYLSNLAKIVVTVNPVNDQPSFTKGADQTVDENSGPITVNGWATNISKGPSNESLQTLTFITTNNNNSLFAVQPYIDSNGNLIYTPATNAYGVATVTVKLKDSGGTDNGGIDESATQTFTIKINSTNTPPRAINDVNTTYAGTPVNGNVLTNDSDPEGNTLTVTTQTNTPTSNGGTVTVNADGTYIYTPPAGFTGEDTFTYTVCDNGTPSACSTATVTIEVMPQPTSENDAPVAVNDNYQGTINKGVSGNILSNDFDPDGTSLTVSSAMADTNGDGAADDALTLGTLATVYGKNASGTTVQAGTLTISNTGAMSFTPNADFTGTVPFTYNASDGSLTDNADGTITIEANPSSTNTTFATDDAYNINEDGSLTGKNVLTNDNDPEGNAQSIKSVWADTDGDGKFDNNVVVGTPTKIYGNDGNGKTVPAGTLTVNSDGTFSYVPAPDYNGDSQFSYQVQDNGTPQATDKATVYLSVNAVNDPPRAINDVNTTYTGTPVNGNVLTNDSDPEGNTLTVTTQTNASTSGGGTVTVNADGTYIYTPPAGFTGEDTFTYQVCDNGTPSACSTATVTIDVMPQPTTSNDPPVAVNDNYQGSINKPVSGNILSNDFDPDGTTLTVSSAKADTNGDGLANESLTLGTSTPVYGKNANGSTVQAGILTISNTGAMSFTPNADFTGTVPFTYNASDGSLTDNADGTITIESNPSNTNTTFATDDAYNVKSGHTLSGVSVLTNDNDPQGNTQTVQSVLADTDGDGLFDDAVSLGSTTQVYGKDNSGNIVIIGTLKVAATGEVTLVPTPNFAGTTQFVYTVSDNGTPQATDKATAYISVGKNTNYWIGTTSTNWNTTTNWTDNEVPFTGQDIEFATAANNNGNAAVNDLRVPGSGATPTEIGSLTNLSTKSTVIPAGNALIIDGTVTGSSTPSDAGKIVIQTANGTPNGTIIIDCASNSTGGVTNAVYGTVQMFAKGFKDSETTWTDNFTGSPTYGQTFTTSYHWQQFGVPVESVQAEPSFYGSYIRAYDEKYNGDNTTYYNKWHVLNNSSMLDAFKGYEITQDVQTVYQLQGKLQFCDKTIHLTREAPGVGTKDVGELESNWRYGLGQNVFGNSFTSSIAIDKMVFPTNVEKTVYLYNTGRFTDWGNAAETPNDGTALTAGQYTAIPQNASPAIYDQGIPSMNGFLLKFTDAETVYSTTGADVTLSYSNGGVKPNTKPQTVKGANGVPSTPSGLSSLSVQLQSKSTVDRLWLLSESGTSRNYENGWDGRKYFGTPTAFIYTESSEGTPLQVSTSENIDGTVISFYDNGDKDYTLVLTKKNLENYSNLQLIDLKEKTFTPLTNDTTIYSFTSQSKDILERRFVITNVSGAKISSDAFKNLSGYLKDNDKLEIMNFTSREGMMYLYDTSGRVLKTARIAVSENEIPVSLQPGVYIVRLEADGKRESIKIAVR